MEKLFSLIEKFCNIPAVSGNENKLVEEIINEIKDQKTVTYYTDNLGNLIVNKKGKNKASKKLMLDAHLDEVGIIVTFIEDDGMIRFSCVGGIEVETLLCKRIKFKNATGVIGTTPIHLQEDVKATIKSTDELLIDIGAKTKEEALKYVSLGEVGWFEGEFSTFGDNMFISRAIDDRAGVSVLVYLLLQESDYDFTCSFSVLEEVGLKGAGASAYKIKPDVALIIEGTTAGDILGVSEYKKVCRLNKGPAVSFMDRCAIYDKDLYNLALNSGIKAQPKSYVSGGNNSGAIQTTAEGTKVLALSLPTRYIHSGFSVASFFDLENLAKLTKTLINKICE